MTQPDGSEVRVLYEGNGRLSRVETPTAAYAYSYLASGNLGSVSAGGQTLTYGYDGPLPKSVNWSGSVAGSVAYTYDNNFRLTAETAAGAPVTVSRELKPPPSRTLLEAPRGSIIQQVLSMTQSTGSRGTLQAATSETRIQTVGVSRSF
jgi:hypothetical protein